METVRDVIEDLIVWWSSVTQFSHSEIGSNKIKMHEMGCDKNRNIERKGRNEKIARNLRRCQEEINNKSSDTASPTPAVLNRPQNLSSREVFEDLLSIGIVRNPKRTVGGIAFDIGSTGLPRRPPRRLAKIEKTSAMTEIYTAEEKALMAEMLRDEEVKEKALKRDLRQDKARRRRMLKEAAKKLKVEKKMKDYDERKKKLTDKITKEA